MLFAYVIMIDHLHLLTSKPSTTSEVLRVLKGLTARRVIDYLSETIIRALWQSCSIENETATTNTHCGKERKTCFPSLAKQCLWRNSTTFIRIRCGPTWLTER